MAHPSILALRLLTLTALACAFLPALAADDRDWLAPRVVLKGYDPIAYFTTGKAVKGSPKISYDWDDGRYHFASARHRDMFAADPERYAPRFGGYCTGSLVNGNRYEPDPQHWAIVGGKLYLFGSATAREQHEKDSKAVAVAEKAWQRLR